MTNLRPILDGDLATRAMDAVRDIDGALTPEAVATVNSSLGSGLAGIALFHGALGEATGTAAHTERAIALMDTAVDDVAAQERIDASFLGRTVGVGWSVSRLSRVIGDTDDDETDIDHLVLRMLSVDPWPAHFDLVNGLVGLGAYCLERLPRPSARAGLDAAVARLDGMALHGPDGTVWYTTPAIYPVRVERYPEGHYDLGFAHGNAGVVALLAAAANAGAAGAKDLLRGAVDWLSAHYEEKGDTAFPGMFTPSGDAEPARMAWCYGDPGVALALLAAGRALGDEALVALARDTALRCEGRVETTVIVDAGLCHGSAGAAHLFNRLGQSLGEERLVDLARYWFTRALDDRGPEGVVAGFTGILPPGATEQVPTYGLLEGVAGTGLALLTAATGNDPWWDFPLLLDATATGAPPA